MVSSVCGQAAARLRCGIASRMQGMSGGAPEHRPGSARTAAAEGQEVRGDVRKRRLRGYGLVAEALRWARTMGVGSEGRVIATNREHTATIHVHIMACSQSASRGVQMRSLANSGSMRWPTFWRPGWEHVRAETHIYIFFCTDT